VAELRSLAEYCNFGDFLEKMIWDCLVCVVNEEGNQRILLAEGNLTYEAAVRIAQGLGTVCINLKEMRHPLVEASTKEKVEPLHAARSLVASNNFELLCHCCGSPRAPGKTVLI